MTMPGSDFLLVISHSLHLDFMTYASKLISNTKLLFNSYILCDFIANIKTNIALLCKAMCLCGALIIIIRSKPGKILISSELF